VEHIVQAVIASFMSPTSKFWTQIALMATGYAQSMIAITIKKLWRHSGGSTPFTMARPTRSSTGLDLEFSRVQTFHKSLEFLQVYVTLFSNNMRCSISSALWTQMC